jgi:type VI secretion system protein ImpE
MSADQLLRDGKLDEALSALAQQIRANPADSKLRVFLFQLLAVDGQWERALTQLQVAGEMDPIHLAMVQTYREAIRCELFRAEVFAGQRSPLVFGKPDEWLAHLMQALQLAAQGQYEAASRLRDQAFEAAPATSGTISTASFAPVPESEAAPKTETASFEWLADADTRLGPVLEAIVNGRYYWIPLMHIQRIVVDPPADLRDVVWMPVHFVWSNGGDSVGLIPTRYPGSEKSPDPLIRLSRKTEWSEPAPGSYFGQGQRVLAADTGEFSLMEVREIRLTSPQG